LGWWQVAQWLNRIGAMSRVNVGGGASAQAARVTDTKDTKDTKEKPRCLTLASFVSFVSKSRRQTCRVYGPVTTKSIARVSDVAPRRSNTSISSR
jgi:hypothetical protein